MQNNDKNHAKAGTEFSCKWKNSTAGQFHFFGEHLQHCSAHPQPSEQYQNIKQKLFKKK